ncbi:hypothetical protein BKA62DRAFT_806071 [Auriculariales sp. MPI-PUGE-AT-0066]|nr:hypothetical protein BKA62DRAFT_806071 [Auriculariales sp. MPI-PUGE-AT-0066]
MQSSICDSKNALQALEPLISTGVTTTINEFFDALAPVVLRTANLAQDAEASVKEVLRISKTVLRLRLRDWNAQHDSGWLRNRLPPEILSHILATLSIRDVVTFSHVSGHWRAFALASSQLWSNIDVTLRRPTPGPDYVDDCFDDGEPANLLVRDNASMSFIQTCVERSRHLPLMLRVNFDEAQDNSHVENQLVSILTSHWDRIKLLDVPIRLNNAIFLQPAPLLTHLYCREPGLSEVISIPAGFLGGVPGRLEGLIMPAYLSLADAPHPALSTLRSISASLHFSTLERIFQSCSKLQECSVWISRSLDQHLVLPPHANLRALSLETHSHRLDISQLLRHQNLTAMTKLHLQTVPKDTITSAFFVFRTLQDIVEARLERSTLRTEAVIMFRDSIGAERTVVFNYMEYDQSYVDYHAVEDIFDHIATPRNLSSLTSFSVDELFLGVLELGALQMTPIQRLDIYAQPPQSETQQVNPFQPSLRMPAQLPRLEHVTWMVDGRVKSVISEEHLARTLRKALAFDGRQLQILTIRTTNAHEVRRGVLRSQRRPYNLSQTRSSVRIRSDLTSFVRSKLWPLSSLVRELVVAAPIIDIPVPHLIRAHFRTPYGLT